MTQQSNLNKLTVPVSTVTMVATSALFDVMMSAPAMELAWMEQQGVRWLIDVAPHDNLGRICTRVYKTSTTQLLYELPSDAYRFTKLGIRFGGRQYSLTVDPSLSMPENVEFYCNNEEGSTNNNWMPYGFAPFRSSIPYNTNYYRMQDGMIRLSSPPHNGELFMEYLAPAGSYPDSMVHAAYVQPMKNYLLWKFYLQKLSGAADANRGEFNKYAKLASMYEQAYYETMREANRMKIGDLLTDVLDVMNRR